MFDKLRKILPDLSKVKVIEAIIDPDTHLEYIDYALKLKKEKFDVDIVKKQSDELFSDDKEIKDKKRLLTLMAKVDDVSIYRKIERYSQKPDKELKEWAKIAKQESLTLIQSSLLEEEQILISTGLGGKGNKIRFFIVLKAENEEKFSDIFVNVIKKEVNFSLKNNNCNLEKLEFGEYFFSITALFPLDFDIIEKILGEITEELKNVGLIISEKYLLTNVKTIEIDELEKVFREIDRKSISGGNNEIGDIFDLDSDYDDINFDDIFNDDEEDTENDDDDDEEDDDDDDDM